MTSFDRQALLDLLYEFAFWYQNLAVKKELPRALSGIDEQGRQFLIRLDGIALDHDERHVLLHTILTEEQSICYAYGGVVQRTDQEGGEDQLTLIVATDAYFVMGDWAVKRSPDIELEQTELWEGDNPQEVPGAWLLTDAVEHEKNDEARYQNIWKELRQQARFLQRPVSRC